ncbi:hypothetical protein ACC705_34830, partial [Rhizobium ruizarguesonis]
LDLDAVFVGPFLDDAVILKDKASLAEIKGQNVNLVEFSVSHYLLAREAMGQASGTDLKGYESQLDVTKLFAKPADAVAFTASAS